MYDNITLEKGLYNISGKTFTEALAELDRDENYIGTELEGLDAYERQLKRFDIKISGANSDRVEKFFKTTQSAVLFPEFIRRMIKQGMDEASILPYLVAATTYTDGIDYRGLTIVNDEESAAVGVGAEFPNTEIAYSENIVEISKYGREINTSYEVLRKQRLDVFAVVLKSIGANISRTLNIEATEVLKKNASITTTIGDSVTFIDLALFWSSLKGHNMNAMLCSPTVMAVLLSMEEMHYNDTDVVNGNIVKTPYGVTFVKCPGMDDNSLIGFDSTSALEMVLGSDVIVDHEKLISTQIDRIVVSISAGFTKVYPEAVNMLTIG